MLSAWSRDEPLWGIRLNINWHTVTTAVLVLLLLLSITKSTVDANWVPGSDVIVRVAFSAALLMGVLAVWRRVPWWLAVGAGLALAPVAAYFFVSPTLVAAHPSDPGGLALASTWYVRLLNGDASGDVAFFLYLLALLFWVVGGWLAWCVLRWRQTLLGLGPGAAAFATTVLNYPDNQNGYVLAFLALSLFLLLWTNYARSLESFRQVRLKTSSDARWDFWETGVLIMAAVVVLGIFLPPLSRADRTVDIEGGAFRSWADLQQRLNHPVAFGRGTAGGNSIGFSTDVPLGGPIHRTGGVVFTYTLDGVFGGARYFRGVNLARTNNGEWRYAGDGFIRESVPKDQQPAYAEDYKLESRGSLKIQMLKPPSKLTDALFYPGELEKVDRDSVAFQSLAAGPGFTPAHLDTVDKVSGAGRAGGSGQYKVSTLYSRATEGDLRGAGAAYPIWVEPYRNFSGTYAPQPAAAGPAAPGSRVGPNPNPGVTFTGSAYRPSSTLEQIRQLTLQVTAQSANPYDKAADVERFLRANYSYTLSPPEPPRDVDPISYFLFTSKEGYCEYFATAMGDMLRSIGIPTRLVNGYGPGQFDDRLGKYVVRESDAHTWVEIYFPSYGWIPFEPTPDGTYFPISRGDITTSASCAAARDVDICDPSQGDTASDPSQANNSFDRGALDPGQETQAGSFGLLSIPGLPSYWPALLAALLALAALVYAGVSRYLRPRTVAGVWKRVGVLTRLAGMKVRFGETPAEFGRRLGREFPETSTTARELADNFAVAAYAPPEIARSRKDAIMEAWESLRPHLLRRVRARARLA